MTGNTWVVALDVALILLQLGPVFLLGFFFMVKDTASSPLTSLRQRYEEVQAMYEEEKQRYKEALDMLTLKAARKGKDGGEGEGEGEGKMKGGIEGASNGKDNHKHKGSGTSKGSSRGGFEERSGASIDEDADAHSLHLFRSPRTVSGSGAPRGAPLAASHAAPRASPQSTHVVSWSYYSEDDDDDDEPAATAQMEMDQSDLLKSLYSLDEGSHDEPRGTLSGDVARYVPSRPPILLVPVEDSIPLPSPHTDMRNPHRWSEQPSRSATDIAMAPSPPQEQDRPQGDGRQQGDGGPQGEGGTSPSGTGSSAHHRRRSFAIPPARTRTDQPPTVGLGQGPGQGLGLQRKDSFMTITTDPSPPVNMSVFSAASAPAHPTADAHMQEAVIARLNNIFSQPRHALRRAHGDFDVSGKQST